MVLGAAISALGWLLTLGVRFSRKLPKPASDIPRVEQSIRINPNVIKVSVIGTVLIAAGLVLFTPNGRSPEVLPIVGLITAAQLSIAAGVAYSGWFEREWRAVGAVAGAQLTTRPRTARVRGC